MNWENGRVTQENIDEFLSARLSDGDMLLDLAWNIDAPTILTWCHDHNVRYLNTSVELWDPYEDMASTSPTDRTLYVRHQSLTKMINGWGGNGGATAVLEHGANPGLVSHFVKQALAEITTKILTEGRAGNRQAALETALAQGEFNTLSMLTGTKVIHIAERDTQITNTPKQVNEFVNTWSVDGFYEEGIAPAELGWGTHERTLPPRAYTHNDDGPRNQICIAQPGMNTWVRTWVPSGESHGMVIRHGEAYTMCKHLTVKNADGTDAYRPTVHYAYCPSNEAIASVHELKMRDWEMQPKQRLLNDDIIMAFNGREIESSSMLPFYVGQVRPGTSAELTIMRNGETIALDVVVGALPGSGIASSNAPVEPPPANSLGLTISELSQEARDVSGVQGVRIEELQDGPAAKAGLEEGDVIVELNRMPVPDIGAFSAAAEQLPATGFVPVRIVREGRGTTLVLELE